MPLSCSAFLPTPRAEDVQRRPLCGGNLVGATHERPKFLDKRSILIRPGVGSAIDDTSNKVQTLIGKAADQASASVGKLSDQAKNVYGRAAQTTQKAKDVVDPFVQERPYVALGLAAGAGLLLGLLLSGRGSRVIYVRGARH